MQRCRRSHKRKSTKIGMTFFSEVPHNLREAEPVHLRCEVKNRIDFALVPESYKSAPPTRSSIRDYCSSRLPIAERRRDLGENSPHDHFAHAGAENDPCGL